MHRPDSSLKYISQICTVEPAESSHSYEQPTLYGRPLGHSLPAKPSYSHCVKLGRTDDHFSTAARVKKTVTRPTDKTVTVLALVS